jgi:hypothetical protein
MPEPSSKNTGVCLHCAGPITEGVAYVSSGALLLEQSHLNSNHDDGHLAFMHVGFHGKDSDMTDSADIEVVSDLPGGQFDLSFCSLACLKSWFDGMVDQLQADIDSE